MIPSVDSPAQVGIPSGAQRRSSSDNLRQSLEPAASGLPALAEFRGVLPLEGAAVFLVTIESLAKSKMRVSGASDVASGGIPRPLAATASHPANPRKDMAALGPRL